MTRKPSLEERLNAHPHLRERMEALLAIVEDASGDVEKADEAERRVIEELRQMGSDALHAWASIKSAEKEQEVRSGDPVQGHGKKNSAGTRRSG